MPDLAKLESLFHALLEFPEEARAAAAERLSDGDADLARRALRLVAADQEAATANQVARETSSAPREYGNYCTVRLIGSGGMGAVYLAERADGQFQQTVALKIVAPHVAGEAFRERFLAERQILAALNHPNITRLLDGGVSGDGTPFLAMEYVDGQPLDDYCDSRKLSLRARLELFLKVCAPVAYAHRNLVVHRDLKPSNILVTAEGDPKLLDFGTAKLMATAGAPASTVLPMLTFRYSSPEQRSLGVITTSTDIFSLGVILYELLTGAWPFGDPASTEQILRRFARETPMTRPQSAATEAASLSRSTNLRNLQSSLAGDLSTLLAKALAPAPEERYQTVQALSDDIRNWLDGLPVSAKAPSFSYRAGKFLRRRWLPVTGAAVFVPGLFGATLFAVHQTEIARTEARKAEKVNQFLNDMLVSAGRHSFDPQKFTVAQMLDAAAPKLESAWKNDPLIEASLRTSLGASYDALQKFDVSRNHLELARATFHQLGRKAEEANALYHLGLTLCDSGDTKAGIHHFRSSLDLLNTLGREAPPLLVFRVKQSLADTLSASLRQNPEEAQRLFQEAIVLAGHEPSIPRTELANLHTEFGGLLMDQGKAAEAEQLFRQALETYRQQNYEGMVKGQALYYLAILESRREHFEAAREYSRQFYQVTLANVGSDHWRTAQAQLMWARYRAETGETREAVAQVNAGLPLLRKVLPPLATTLWTSLINASHTFNLAGRFDEAEPLARQAMAIDDHVPLAEIDPRRAASLFELASALQGRKRYREAAAAFARAGRIYAQLGPAWALRHAQVQKRLAELEPL